MSSEKVINYSEVATKALAITPIRFTHWFLGFGKHKSCCEVEIYELDGVAFILFVDTGYGTSVTNSAEQLVYEVYVKRLAYKYSKEQLVFAETYQRRKGEKGVGLGSVDIIIPQWNGDAVKGVDWKHLGELIEPKLKTK